MLCKATPDRMGFKPGKSCCITQISLLTHTLEKPLISQISKFTFGCKQSALSAAFGCGGFVCVFYHAWMFRDWVSTQQQACVSILSAVIQPSYRGRSSSMLSPLDCPCKEEPVVGFIWTHCYPQAGLCCCTINTFLDTSHACALVKEKVFKLRIRILEPLQWPLMELIIVYHASCYLANLVQLL